MGENITVLIESNGAAQTEIQFADSLFAENFNDFRMIALHEFCGDDDAANDAMMLLLEVARSKAGQLVRHPNPTGFLYKALKNCIMKQRERMRTKRAETVDISLFESVLFARGETDDPDIEEILDKRAEILGALSGREYALYRDFYVEEKKVSEIAKALGISENALKVRLHRLRAKIHLLAEDVF